MQQYSIDYLGLMSQVLTSDLESKVAFLKKELPLIFHTKYLKMTTRETSICIYYINEFQYIYDNYSQLQATVVVPYSPIIESRVVGVLGCSRLNRKVRDSARLLEWGGPTEKYLGRDTDKGHFVNHNIGGGLDINIFAQRRDLNRGWSNRGKAYRSMEHYCAKHPGTFCFNRPVYSEDCSRPIMFDFGILMQSGELWVEAFEN
jgi:hypothetical protein